MRTRSIILLPLKILDRSSWHEAGEFSKRRDILLNLNDKKHIELANTYNKNYGAYDFGAWGIRLRDVIYICFELRN